MTVPTRSWACAPESVCPKLPSAVKLSLVALAAAVLVGCSAPPSLPPAPPGKPLGLQLASQRLTDDLLAQALRQRTWGSLMAGLDPQPISVAPVIDTRLRPSPEAARLASRWIAERIALAHDGFTVRNPAADGTGRPRWHIRSSLTAPTAAELAATGASTVSAEEAYLLLELVDRETGKVVATSRERITDALLLPPVSQAQVPPPSQPPAPPPPPPTPAEALAALNSEYISLLKKGRDNEAQAVFARIIATGLAARQLNVTLLFAANSTAFWPDPVLQRRYASWLAELAHQTEASPHCLQIVGHASRTGKVEANRALSLRRAQAVRQIMLRQSPTLASRLTVVGAGFDQASATSGSDDERNAADRRVEFKVIDCP